MSIKKKLGGAILTTALGATLIGGGTFALFHSTAENTGNTFTAGTLKISDVTGGAVFKDSVNIGNLVPGDKDQKTLTIQNDGNLDAWVKIDAVTTDADNIANNNIGDLFEGANKVQISYDTASVLIPANSTYTFNTKFEFPKVAGDEYQGKSGTATFNVKAVQARNNTNNANNGPISWQ